MIANKEENRELDVRRLREAGVPVWVTDIETVPQAIASMRAALRRRARLAAPGLAGRGRALWCGARAPPRPARRRSRSGATRGWSSAATPSPATCWPALGLADVFADHAERYPALPVEEIDGAGADLVLLPDEPYVFTAEDGPEAFDRTPTAAGRGPADHLVRPLAGRGARRAVTQIVTDGPAGEPGALTCRATRCGLGPIA